MPESSVQGWQTGGYNRYACNREHETTGWQVAWINHLHNRLATVHGLDFGIHAEMTDFPVWLDLCITMSAPVWEPMSCELLLDRFSGSRSFKSDIWSLGTSKIIAVPFVLCSWVWKLREAHKIKGAVFKYWII